MEKIVLVGSGGHAKSVVDTIEKSEKYEIIGFLEIPDKHNFSYKGYSVVGTENLLMTLYAQGVCNAFITIGYMGKIQTREVLYEKLKKIGFRVPSIVDDTACIANNAQIGEGTFIGKGTVVNAETEIGKMCIINTGAIIEHGCSIGDYSHIAVGTVLCGDVLVDKNTFVGANTTIIQGVKIGKQVIVGAGSVVLHNISDNSKVAGNPVRNL